MNEDDELQDSQTPDETDTDLDNDSATDDLADYSLDENDESNGDDIQVRMSKLEEQNRRLYARLKKTEKPKSEKTETKVEVKETIKEPVKGIDPDALKSELREELRLEAAGYDDNEKEVIIKAARVLGLSPSQAAKDDIVKGKIEQMREETRVQNAIPSPSGKAGTKDTNSVDYYLRTGEIPEDDALADKVDEERIRRAKEQI